MKITAGSVPEGDEVSLDSISCTYWQQADCVSNDEQVLRIETRDGGGGFFYNIKTEGWSFGDVNDLVDVINDFIKRVNYANTDNS